MKMGWKRTRPLEHHAAGGLPGESDMPASSDLASRESRLSSRYRVEVVIPDLAPDDSMTLQIIGAGFGRTGTMSTYTALNQLGFPCYHMIEVMQNKANKSHLDYWRKVAHSDPGTAHDWEQVFAQYTAAVDNPACCVSGTLERHPSETESPFVPSARSRWHGPASSGPREARRSTDASAASRSFRRPKPGRSSPLPGMRVRSCGYAQRWSLCWCLRGCFWGDDARAMTQGSGARDSFSPTLHLE
jgi:hypothetical protein